MKKQLATLPIETAEDLEELKELLPCVPILFGDEKPNNGSNVIFFDGKEWNRGIYVDKLGFYGVKFNWVFSGNIFWFYAGGE